MLLYQVTDDPAQRKTFEALYTRYKGLLYHVAYNILKNAHEAEEVVHDVFLSVLDIGPAFAVESEKMKAYLVTSAENKAINLQKRKHIFSPEGLPPDLPDQGDLTAQVDNSLGACLLRLPKRYQQLLLLRFAQGYSPKETAKIMRISMAAAYKLEQRAKAKLEKICQEEGLLP